VCSSDLPLVEALAERAVEAPPDPSHAPEPVRQETPPTPTGQVVLPGEPSAGDPSLDDPSLDGSTTDGEHQEFVAATLAGSGGVAGDQGGREAGNDVGDALGGGAPGARADYAATLSAWLERHKQYPARAQRRRTQGAAVLYLAIGRDGRVLDTWIELSTGHAILDDELMAMVERAQPLPAFPPEIRAERMEYHLSVDFALR